MSTCIDAILNGAQFCIMPDGQVRHNGATVSNLTDFERDIRFYICDWPDESRAVFENRYHEQVYDLRKYERATLVAIPHTLET